MGARRKARVCALQMLFQFDVAHPRLDELTAMYWDSFGDEMGDVPREFANNLAVGAIAHLEEIDGLQLGDDPSVDRIKGIFWHVRKVRGRTRVIYCVWR